MAKTTRRITPFLFIPGVLLIRRMASFLVQGHIGSAGEVMNQSGSTTVACQVVLLGLNALFVSKRRIVTRMATKRRGTGGAPN